MTYNEASYENAVIEVFRDTLGYEYVYGPDVTRDYGEPLYTEELEAALERLNPTLPQAALDEALRKLRLDTGGSLFQKNERFMEYLQNGISVNYFDRRGRSENDSGQRSALVSLVDYRNARKNSFILGSQWMFDEGSGRRRPDMVVFLNGLPVVVIELKSPSRENTDASEGYQQLRHYQRSIPSLFIYNAFLVISDQACNKAGTITAGEDRFMEWKSKDGSYEKTQYAQFDTFFEGMFEPERLLDIIRNFICFSGESKILAGYHQYFAVRKAIESTRQAVASGGRAGVFWHTQGSGKSLSMIFYTRLLQEVLRLPTVVVLCDRNNLDNQLFEQFAKCAHFLGQEPEQAESRADLRELLLNREAHGIILSTTQKFEESEEELSDRRNIVVIADEAHRSQFIDERVDPDTGRIQKSFGLIVRESLPNATYIGFTGTPIWSKDRSTREVFGNYIDIYDMTQSVEDGATVPVYYESRVLHLKLDAEVLERIDREYEVMAEDAEDYAIERSKRRLGNMESILRAQETLQSLCEDIVKHYEENRQDELTGKAMIVCQSRAIAIDVYRKLLELRPGWREKVGVIVTESNSDPEEWREIIGDKSYRNKMARHFKDDENPFKIAIVVDMWLTGFDVPSLATMYVYKRIEGHNLMQAIARVNRVYKNKAGGLVVDYVGIASALKQAMKEYSRRDQKNYGDMDISKTALPKFIEKLEVCRGLLHGFDYSGFMREGASNLTRAKAISGGSDFLMAVEQPEASPQINGNKKPSKKETFIREARLLREAKSLCRPLITAEQRFEAAYFDSVRVILTRLAAPGKTLSLREINERINDLLKASIKSEGVINLFSLEDSGFSLTDSKFLEEISRMKERNLVVEILQKLLAEQVSNYRKTNLVKSEKFSKILTDSMKRYINGLLTNEEVISKLKEMANEIVFANAAGKELGLSEEELAFYDALTQPEAVKDFYTNEVLVEMTRELTEQLRKNRTIDWQKKESARAGMRRMIKKLLKRYKYPPEGVDFAVSTVIRQCELWADNGGQ